MEHPITDLSFVETVNLGPGVYIAVGLSSRVVVKRGSTVGFIL